MELGKAAAIVAKHGRIWAAFMVKGKTMVIEGVSNCRSKTPIGNERVRIDTRTGRTSTRERWLEERKKTENEWVEVGLDVHEARIRSNFDPYHRSSSSLATKLKPTELSHSEARTTVNALNFQHDNRGSCVLLADPTIPEQLRICRRTARR